MLNSSSHGRSQIRPRHGQARRRRVAKGATVMTAVVANRPSLEVDKRFIETARLRFPTFDSTSFPVKKIIRNRALDFVAPTPSKQREQKTGSAVGYPLPFTQVLNKADCADALEIGEWSIRSWDEVSLSQQPADYIQQRGT